MPKLTLNVCSSPGLTTMQRAMNKRDLSGLILWCWQPVETAADIHACLDWRLMGFLVHARGLMASPQGQALAVDSLWDGVSNRLLAAKVSSFLDFSLFPSQTPCGFAFHGFSNEFVISGALSHLPQLLPTQRQTYRLPRPQP